MARQVYSIGLGGRPAGFAAQPLGELRVGDQFFDLPGRHDIIDPLTPRTITTLLTRPDGWVVVVWKAAPCRSGQFVAHPDIEMTVRA